MYFIEALQLCTLCILLINVMFYTEGFHSPIETEPETQFLNLKDQLVCLIQFQFYLYSTVISGDFTKTSTSPLKEKKVADCKIRNLLYGFL